jgi:hypothetical protein
MNEPLPFRRVVARTAFVLLLLYIVAAPQLRSDNPGPGFDTVADWTTSMSLLDWLLIGFAILALLAVFTTISRLRYQNKMTATQVERNPAADRPISEAVKATLGGNGLASEPVEPYLAFFDLAGWIQIKEPDKECLVIDAKYVIRNTRLYAAPLRLLGKPISARRVLLSPAPLNDVSAEALTADHLNLTLKVSVKYTVADPAYVAGLEDPLSELNNLLTGASAEYIRSQTLEGIVRDDGTLRRDLKRRMEESETIRSRYHVIEVLKALPTGDERMIEIIRQTREAIQRQALVEQESKNLQVAADYELAARRAREELRDEFEQRQHVRDLELNHLHNQFELQREVMRSIAAIAASGINPTAAIREIRSLVLEDRREELDALPNDVVITDEQIDVERRSLERIQTALAIRQFALEPVPGSPGKPASARIDLDDFSVLINCPIGYPSQEPSVRIRLGENGETPIIVPWREGSNLADATTAAVMQARIMIESQTE